MKRRWIQLGLDLVEVTGDYTPPLPVDSGALWGDRGYDGMRATDGAPIDSRSKHREYMRARGLTTADDYSGEWAEARRIRDEWYTKGRDPSRREDVARALEKVKHG